MTVVKMQKVKFLSAAVLIVFNFRSYSVRLTVLSTTYRLRFSYKVNSQNFMTALVLCQKYLAELDQRILRGCLQLFYIV